LLECVKIDYFLRNVIVSHILTTQTLRKHIHVNEGKNGVKNRDFSFSIT